MYGIHFGIRGCLINILKYKDMNSVEYSPFDGGMIQVHLVSVIEPWYIRKESRSEEISATGEIYPIMASTFIEYYY